MATATIPAKPRKQLADQLDRLDGIIDVLADGLPQAVADATRAGTRQTLVELLADPEVLARLKAALVPDVPEAPVELVGAAKRPGPFARLKSAVVKTVAKVVHRAMTGIATAADKAKTMAVGATSRVRAVVIRHFRVDVPVVRYATVALTVGALAASVGYAAPPEFAAALCGLGAAVMTGAMLVGVRIRGSRSLVPASTRKHADPSRGSTENESQIPAGPAVRCR